MRHIPVLKNEVLEALQPLPGQLFVDCTLGDAGHAEAILEATSPNGRLVGFDTDPEAILRAKHFLERFGERVVYVRENFSTLASALEKNGITEVNGILIDLGWSTPQFAERGRGFSFLNNNEPLDMRYSAETEQTRRSASEIVNESSVDDLAAIIREYGEEPLADEIAKEIDVVRGEKKIETVGEFKEAILRAYRKKLRTEKEIPWIGGLHPATKTFQAIRIAVNDELGVIKTVLPVALSLLAPKGKLAVITFHSLEDRIVKHLFKDYDGNGFQMNPKKPIQCSEAEWEENPPSRSAKLRVIQKL